MTKEEKTKLVEEAKASLKRTKGDAFLGESAREMPLLAGDEFVVTMQTGEVLTSPKWTYFVCKDGSRISASQLIRRRNGLNLTGNTNDELTDSFMALFDENGELPIKVLNVRQRTGMFDGTPTVSNYATFEQK